MDSHVTSVGILGCRATTNQPSIRPTNHSTHPPTQPNQPQAMKLSLERKKNQPAMYVRHRMFGRDDAIPVDFGTTAVVAIHADGKLVVANAGDSSAILYSWCVGSCGHVVLFSFSFLETTNQRFR